MVSYGGQMAQLKIKWWWHLLQLLLTDNQLLKSLGHESLWSQSWHRGLATLFNPVVGEHSLPRCDRSVLLRFTDVGMVIISSSSRSYKVLCN